MRQRTLGGNEFEPEHRECEWGAMCPEKATHVATVAGSNVPVCGECVEAHDLYDATVASSVRELRPGERVEKDEYERVDTSQEPAGWSP